MTLTSLRSAFRTGLAGPATSVKLVQATGPSEERPDAGACLQYASVTLAPMALVHSSSRAPLLQASLGCTAAPTCAL